MSEAAKGIPLDFRHGYTKADWELWIAGATDDPTLRQNIIDEVFNYANTTTCATPFPDWYDPSGTFTGFSARPVMGGAYVLLLARHPTPVRQWASWSAAVPNESHWSDIVYPLERLKE